MSLRTRLLLAVGAVALLALAVAGALTYSSTRAYLYAQVDQALVSDCTNLGGPLTSAQQVSFQTVGRSAPGAFVELRGPSGKTLGSVPAIGADGLALVSALPAHISLPVSSTGTGGSSPHGPNGPSVMFTVASAGSAVRRSGSGPRR